VEACLSVVIPAYNELATIDVVLDRVLAQPATREVIVVDDCSTDGTRERLAALDDPRVVVLFQPFNQGKGAALRRGFGAATSQFVVVQDADLEYDPADFPALLGPLVDGRADVVFGSRFLTGGAHRVLYYWHSVGNRLLTTASNVATNLNLTDMETCYKAFRREVIQSLDLREDRFGIEPEVTAKIAAGGWRVYEVGVSYHGRTYAEGKKIGWRDGVRALYCIARYSGPGRAVRARLDAPARSPLPPPVYPAGWLAELVTPWLGGRVAVVGADAGLVALLAAAPGAEQPIAAADTDSLIGGLSGDEPTGFDCIVVAGSLGQRHRPETDLAALRSVLAPGGRIVAVVPGPGALRLGAPDGAGRFDRAGLRRALAAAELRPEVVRPVSVAASGPTAGASPAGTYDRAVAPVRRVVGERVALPLGQSLFCVAVAASIPERVVSRRAEGKVVVLP
jgi:SAM-dependent methyltransferase